MGVVAGNDDRVGFLAAMEGDIAEFDPLVEGAGLQPPFADGALGEVDGILGHGARIFGDAAAAFGGVLPAGVIDGDEADVIASGFAHKSDDDIGYTPVFVDRAEEEFTEESALGGLSWPLRGGEILPVAG